MRSITGVRSLEKGTPFRSNCLALQVIISRCAYCHVGHFMNNQSVAHTTTQSDSENQQSVHTYVNMLGLPPLSRHPLAGQSQDENSIHRRIAMTIVFSSSLQSCEFGSVMLSRCLQGGVSHPFSQAGCESNRTRHPSGSSNTVMRLTPALAVSRRRETLVPNKVQGDFAEPWLLRAQRQSGMARCPGDTVICKQRAAQGDGPIRTMASHQSQYWARSPCTTFNQSSGLSQMACAPEVCDSRHAPACAPAP
ncbi:hypothetical protein QFZ98_004439 [Paraburkholderia youngii]